MCANNSRKERVRNTKRFLQNMFFINTRSIRENILQWPENIKEQIYKSLYTYADIPVKELKNKKINTCCNCHYVLINCQCTVLSAL